MKRSRSGNQKKGNDWDNIDDDGPTVVGGGAGSREEDDEESNNKQPPPSLPSQEERQGGRPKKMARGMDLEFEKPKPNFLRMLRGGQSNPEQDKQLQQQLERTKGPRSTAEPKVRKTIDEDEALHSDEEPMMDAPSEMVDLMKRQKDLGEYDKEKRISQAMEKEKLRNQEFGINKEDNDRDDFSIKDDDVDDKKHMNEQELQKLRDDNDAQKTWKKVVHKAHRNTKEHGVSFSSSFTSSSNARKDEESNQQQQQTTPMDQDNNNVSKRKQQQIQQQKRDQIKKQDSSKLSFNMDDEE